MWWLTWYLFIKSAALSFYNKYIYLIVRVEKKLYIPMNENRKSGEEKLKRHIKHSLKSIQYKFSYRKYRRINFMNCHHIKIYLSLFCTDSFCMSVKINVRKTWFADRRRFFPLFLFDSNRLRMHYCNRVYVMRVHFSKKKIEMIKLNSDFNCSIHGVTQFPLQMGRRR